MRKLRTEILSIMVWSGFYMATLALRGAASRLFSLSNGAVWYACGEKGRDCAAVVADAIMKLPFLLD